MTASAKATAAASQSGRAPVRKAAAKLVSDGGGRMDAVRTKAFLSAASKPMVASIGGATR